MKPKETYISDKYKYEDYLELDFNINSPTKVWNKAIDIFKSRIESRYFYAIKKLMNKHNKKEMIKRNLISGIFRGVGIGVGVTIITAILVIILQKIVSLNIPIIGEYIADIVDIVQRSR